MSPWTVKDRRRRGFAHLLVLLAMGLAIVAVVGPAQATSHSEPVQAVANAIDSFSNRLASASDALGEYQDLANDLPLTELASGDPDALDLTNLLKDKLASFVGGYANMAELAAEIEAKDDDSGELKIQFGNGDDLTGPVLAPGQDDVSWTDDSITIPIHVERHVDQPLDFSFGTVAMAGGSLGIDFELDTTLTFHVDAAAVTDAATASPNALSLDPPQIDLCARATGSVGVFTARFGFTDVKVSTDNPLTTSATETASLHACAEVVFSDPDSVGGITLDEWTSHALTELAAADLVKGNPSGSDLDVTLYADASLVGGDAFVAGTAADASVSFHKADLSAPGDPTTTPNIGPGLQPWLNITDGDVANGLAQFVASFAAAQGVADAPLPLVGKSLTEVFDGVKPLLDYTDRLLAATVGCGTEPGDEDNFPTGVTDNLTTGTLVYCRAQTQHTKVNGTVEWTVPTGVTNVDADCTDCVNTSGTDADATLGTAGVSPTADAVFEMTAPGNFTIEVSWTEDAGPPVKTRTAIPRPGSAQELFDRITDAAGLDDAALNLGYDASKKALTFRLKKDNLDPAPVSVGASIGDLLRNKTNIAGLKEASGNLTANVDDVDFDLTFGVLLNQHTSDITPLRGQAESGGAGTLTDDQANFTDGVNDPRLGQVLKKTTAPTGQCTIGAIAEKSLTCASAPSNPTWGAGDGYDVDGGLLDRFYVKVNPGAPELSVGNVGLAGNALLSGTIGFLGIEAGGDGTKNTFDNGTAFGVGRADNTKPALRVDVKAPNAFTIEDGGTQTIADAVGVGELLFNLDSAHVEAVCNLRASAGLGITAKVNGKTLGSGSVALNWPQVFEAGSCTPDVSSLAVAADTDFDVNLRNFDPFPSVSGTHTRTGALDHLIDDSKDFTKVGFTIGAPTSPTGGNNLQNLTLRNKTTGASCTIATVSANELGCTLSGGTRAGDTANANKWLSGDEYEVEGNALAWLAYILDNLDKVVEQVDQLDPGLTDKELPLVGISTKDLVGKIKSIKQTTDELRGSPLATIECAQNPDGSSAQGFDVSLLPRGTTIHCRAVTTVNPTEVKWSLVKDPGGPDRVVVGANANSLGTVGANPLQRVAIEVGDPTQVPANGSPANVSIGAWQIKVEFTDAAGNHNVELPTSSPPRSLQELSDLIEDKLGVSNVLELEVLDLPAAGAGPRKSGTATGGSTADVLEDTSADFTSGTVDEQVFVGNLLINKANGKYCTITLVAEEQLTCAAGSNMGWASGNAYEVVGDRTKDLVVRLGVGFCSGAGLCESNDRNVPAVQAPLNVSGGFADLVAVETEGDIQLHYDATAQLHVGISIELGLPDVVVLDTSGVSLEASLNANDIGLSAALGPFTVQLGTSIADTDPLEDGAQQGIGIGKLGAQLSLGGDDDTTPNNKTRTFGGFLSSIPGSFSFDGSNQACDDGEAPSPDAEGHACALLHVQASIGGITTPFTDPIKVECEIGAPQLCDVDLPSGLEGLLNGEPLDWTLLLQVLPQILKKLETSLDGAAQNVKLPLVGNTLDAGANVVGTFNTQVVTPFAQLANQLKTAGDQDSDGDTDAWDLAKLARQFVLDQIGPSGLLLDTNGVGGAAGNVDDIVVTPLCGPALAVCGNNQGVASNFVRDFRVTFKIGKAINGQVPFDIGLKGLPLRLQGGVQGGGSWSVLLDFGLSLKEGPYIVANGKKGFTGSEDRDFDTHCEGTDPADPFDCHEVVKYLQDDSKDFNGSNNADPADDLVELGMWLHKTGTDQGCRVTKVEQNRLWCDDFGTTSTVEGVDWDGDDGYELRARHGLDTPSDGSADPDAQPELTVDANVRMGDNAAACSGDDPAGLPAYLAGYSANTRCLKGQIAFLQVTVRDKDVDLNCSTLSSAIRQQTALCLGASLDFRKSGGPRVTISDLISGNLNISPRLVGKANVDVRLRTGLNVGQSAGFPSVLGKFHLFWGFTVAPLENKKLELGQLDVAFDGLALDAGKFLTEFLGPMVKQVKDVTNPLMPVVETLQGEVPIISDLSKLVGQGPVTALDLLEAISGNDLSLLRSILQMVKFVNSLPGDGALVIPLGTDPNAGGSFKVTGARAGNSPPLPQNADEGITNKVAGSDLINELGKTGSPYQAAKTTPAQCDRGATFGVCGLTFPFLGDASQIFGVLMGKDATLIHYDAGSFGAGAGFGFCFPPIIIGPVPVQICIGGSFRIDGRFAMGYDTSGLRKVLAGGTGTHLLDGIYFDDYDAKGVDVPEVKFTGRVYAEGAVSVYIFKVGIRGEIIFTTGLNLHEDPPQDGKLRIEEVIAKIYNPICLFDVEGKIEAALSAFVKIDFFIKSVEFSIQIVKVTLLEFNLSVCNVKPVLAFVSGDDLVLNMGNLTRRNARGIAAGEINETFTVRQMESSGGNTRFSVSAFGIQQDYFLPTSKVNDGTARLVANADNGNDVIALLPGSASGEQANPNEQKPSIPFVLRAVITGGTGDDEITTGDGNDDVNGQENNDTISTGAGVDKIVGGEGNDKIDAGPGNDTDVHGNDGDDIVSGGPGADKLFGDAGNDVISAGPGDSGSSIDELTGGPGDDTLNADGGGDKLWGDEGGLSFSCTGDTGNDGSTSNAVGNGRDTLVGAAGPDQMHGGNNADTLDGADGNDTMCGGGGRDEMTGGPGKDTMSGNGGDDNMIGSADDGTGDVMNGNGGRDYMLGDDGTLSRSSSNVVTPNVGTGTTGGPDTMKGGPGRDFMWGQGGADAMDGNAGNDEMRGGPGNDVMRGDLEPGQTCGTETGEVACGHDEMYGDDGMDTMRGNAGNDYMRGGTGTDTMDGDAGNDELYGDNDRDIMRGGDDDDLMRGGGGDDYMEGNGNDSSALDLDDATNPLANVNFDLHLVKNTTTGAWAKAGGGDGDVMYGDAGQDDMIGGSSTAAADDGDTMLGNTEQDVIVGDNGTITRPTTPVAGPDGTWQRTVTLLDPGGTVGANSGGDWIQGNLGNDDVYAGGGGDLVHGDEGDDYVEGNGGSDGAGVLGGPPVAAIGLYGDSGQDDLIGGTSQGSGGVLDGADDLWGGQGHDVIAGDNASIARSAGTPGTCGGFACNTFRSPDVVDVVLRTVQLWDVATTASSPAAGTSGGDTSDGQDGHDRISGQGGNDHLKGGLNDDFVFGNAGADTIFGGDGQDDLVGGTGRTNSAAAATAEDGRLDAGDLVYGEAGVDAIAGDNARVVRATDGVDDDHGLWQANTFNFAVDRIIALMDVGVVGSPAGAGTSGNDRLLGGGADDVVYGQGGNDSISGGDGQDLLEGNANGQGNADNFPGADAYADWPTFAGDVIHGDAGADDVGGGTGRIYRMDGGAEVQDPASGVDGRLDGADTIYGDGGGDALAGDNTVIERALTEAGGWVLDDLHDDDALGVVRRIMRLRDVALVGAPAGAGTSGDDVIYGNDGVDVAYGQGGNDTIQGNAHDDHLEGNAGADTIQGNEGRDDIVGGTGRTFSNDESTAADGRIDNQVGNDVLHGGDGQGGVASDDDDVIIGDNGTIDRVLGTLGSTGAELDRLPFNGAWGETSWNEPNILRVVRLLDVARTGAVAPETDGTNGPDMLNGEAGDDVLLGQGADDTITGDDADLGTESAADANPGDDYVEGGGGSDTIRGDLGEDDITGGGSAANGVLDANRDGRFDDTRSGETLRDAGDTIDGDSGDGALGAGDVVAGDNARIQRLLDGSGDWRTDDARGTRLRDVFLFDVRIVGSQAEPMPGNADPGESGADTINGNGGNDILLGQDNGQTDDAAGDAYGREDGSAVDATHPPNCQNATGGPGTGTISGLEEAPNGDDDDDDLPDLNDPECRVPAPGDAIHGQGGQDYIEGNSGSDTLTGGEDEDDVVGGSSTSSDLSTPATRALIGHLNVILPPADRDAGFAPGTLAESVRPNNLNDGHDVIEGNAEDDTVVGDNAFVDRYVGTGGAWVNLHGDGSPGGVGYPESGVPDPEPARGPWTVTDVVVRDVTTVSAKELPLAFGNDWIRGGTGKDDVYGLLGHDWLEGNEDEDAIVGDMGKIVGNVIGDGPGDPAQQFLTPQQPFLGSTVNYTGMLKREVTLYAFNQSLATAGIGHDVALGGDGNDWIHTGPGEDLANGNAGDDRIFLGDNHTAITASQRKGDVIRLAHDRVDAGWGGEGHDHLWGGYGADYLDVRPRKLGTDTAAGEVAGLFPTSDPETWFQVAGAELSHNGVDYAQDNFDDMDYIYGGWDQDTLQANIGDNGPHVGDRLLDWGGSFNGYYLCPATYGDWVSTRALAPGVVAFLQGVSQGDGATTTATPGTSGFRETAIVFTNEQKDNTKPIHADTPAHFTCGPGTTP